MARLLGKFEHIEIYQVEESNAVSIRIGDKKYLYSINELFKLNAAITRACNALLSDKVK